MTFQIESIAAAGDLRHHHHIHSFCHHCVVLENIQPQQRLVDSSVGSTVFVVFAGGDKSMRSMRVCVYIYIYIYTYVYIYMRYCMEYVSNGCVRVKLLVLVALMMTDARTRTGFISILVYMLCFSVCGAWIWIFTAHSLSLSRLLLIPNVPPTWCWCWWCVYSQQLTLASQHDR